MQTLWPALFPALFNDLRYALRQLRKSPGFAVAAMLTLALGVGANSAIFSLLDQALLRSLPVQNPQQLVYLEGTGKAWQGHGANHGGDQEAYFSYPMYRDLRDQNQAFSGLLATSPAPVNFTRNGASQLVKSELVSGNYFSVLGVQPAAGRLFTQSEDRQKDANPVTVLSFDFWKNHLGGDASIIGSDISINDHPFHIIGVASPRFHSAVWGETPALFVPMSMLGQIMPGKDKLLTDHTDRWMNIIARLKPGESAVQAAAAMAPLWHALRAEELKALGTRSKQFTDNFLTTSRLLILPGARGFSYSRDDYQKWLLMLMGMALLVLLIAAVNVASLLLVRSAGRVREFSLRVALGAGQNRILQQLLLEGLLIGTGGSLIGLGLASLAIRTLAQRLAAEDGSMAFSTSVDHRLLLFNFAVALVVSVLFSLAPAVQLRRPDLTAMLGQRSATGSGHLLSFRRTVVCVQIGLSVVLLAGAGLFVRTMQKLQQVNPGFNTSHLVSFGITPSLAGYAPGAVPALYQRAIDALSALPGVSSIAVTDDPELAGYGQRSGVSVAGYTAPPDEDLSVEYASVNENYFSALQVPLLAGRTFNEMDREGHPLVAVVNQSFAKHYCRSAQDCIGRHLGNGRGTVPLDTEIVGVVHDAKHEGIREDILGTYFKPLRQNAGSGGLYFYLRTTGDPSQTLSLVRRTMQQLDPSLALDSLKTMDQQIEYNLASDRLVTLLAAAFGILAVLLAGVGMYGVLAYSTAQRTREIGIRMALGSSRLAISNIILRDVLLLASLGIGLALPLSFALSYLLRSQLFGVSPVDPLSLLSAVALVSLVALFAALIPASRAASTDPVDALRTE